MSYPYGTLTVTTPPVWVAVDLQAGTGTDIKAANSAALTSALATLEAAGGGILYLPAGTFWLSTAVTIDVQHVTIQGVGREATLLKNDTGTMFYLGASDGNSNPNHLKIRDLTIDARAGHMFEVLGSTNMSYFNIDECYLVQTSTGHSIYYQSNATANITNSCWSRSTLEHVAAATVPAFYFRGPACNENVFWQLKCTTNGTAHFFHIESSSNTGGGPCASVRFRDIDFTSCAGGAIKALGMVGMVVDSCNPQENVTYVNDVFYLGPSVPDTGTAVPSRDCTFAHIIRSSGSLGSKVDIYLTDTGVDGTRTKDTTIINCRNNGGSNYTINCNGMRATCVGLSPQGVTVQNSGATNFYPSIS